jgi:hypothetical protein
MFRENKVERGLMQLEEAYEVEIKKVCIHFFGGSYRDTLWNMKCMITPLIIGATGRETKGFKGKIWKPY